MLAYSREMNWFFEKGEIWYRSQRHGSWPERPAVVHWKGYVALGVLAAVMIVEMWGMSFLPAHSTLQPVFPIATMLIFLVIHNRHHQVIDLDAPPKPKLPDKIFPGGL